MIADMLDVGPNAIFSHLVESKMRKVMANRIAMRKAAVANIKSSQVLSALVEGNIWVDALFDPIQIDKTNLTAVPFLGNLTWKNKPSTSASAAQDPTVRKKPRPAHPSYVKKPDTSKARDYIPKQGRTLSSKRWSSNPATTSAFVPTTYAQMAQPQVVTQQPMQFQQPNSAAQPQPSTSYNQPAQQPAPMMFQPIQQAPTQFTYPQQPFRSYQRGSYRGNRGKPYPQKGQARNPHNK